MSEPFRLTCPFCGKHLRFKPTAAGTQARCPNSECRELIRLPSSTAIQVEVAAAQPKRALWLWLPIGGILLVFLSGLGIWLLSRPKSDQTAAINQATKDAEKPVITQKEKPNEEEKEIAKSEEQLPLIADEAPSITMKVLKTTESKMSKTKALLLSVEIEAKDDLDLSFSPDSITLTVGEKKFQSCYIAIPAESPVILGKQSSLEQTAVDGEKVYKIIDGVIRVPLKKGKTKLLLVFPEAEMAAKMLLEFPMATSITLVTSGGITTQEPKPSATAIITLPVTGPVKVIPGDGDKPYVGPPPPVEFDIKGYKVVSSVPFGGRVEIRDGQIRSPAAPEGYEFTSEHKEIILGRPHSFGWKPKSGSLLLVVCKVTVKDPAPRLERIRLMQGKQEVVGLDGLAQPGFDKANAKDLNNGMTECHKSGKTPEVCLVFRVPDGGMTNPTKLAVEVEWLSHEGKPLSGTYLLQNVPSLQDEKQPEPQPEKPKPTKYKGEWRGPPSDEVHVEAVVFEEDTFPCKGTVKFGGKGVGIGTPVSWEQEEGQVIGTKDGQVVARVKLADRMISGDITVPESARFFLGNARAFTITGFEKR